MRGHGTGRGWAREGAQHEAATLPLGPARRPLGPVTRPALAATRPGQRPRYGHCARLGVPGRAWVCSAGPGGVFCAL